jgi:hypothetical protein
LQAFVTELMTEWLERDKFYHNIPHYIQFYQICDGICDGYFVTDIFITDSVTDIYQFEFYSNCNILSLIPSQLVRDFVPSLISVTKLLFFSSGTIDKRVFLTSIFRTHLDH